MHLQNLQVFTFSHTIVEKFRDVIIDVVYLAVIREFASTPQVWMILIQVSNCLRALFLYFPHVPIELLNSASLGSRPHVLIEQITRVMLLKILPQMPHTFSMFHTWINIITALPSPLHASVLIAKPVGLPITTFKFWMNHVQLSVDSVSITP
jgi:hypothetical protein